ncbi:MAG: cyclopropane-fatty-acyl-phospholipid synthase family protein [Rhodospirillaceae bacterium]|nr:cyclopropane-fatty-acyl-phospholipid synthase family protein [Rhodospirillaceae bacterium]
MDVNLQWQREAPTGPTRSHSAVGTVPGLTAPGRRRSLWAVIGFFLLRNLLSRIIRHGELTLIAPDGRSHTFGRDGASVTVRIASWKTVWRMFFNPDLALGEDYMNGDVIVESGSIYDFVDLCLSNLGWSYGHWIQRAHGLIRRTTRRLAQYNPAPIARRNVAHHYDLSDTLYDLFLCADRQYSCAYYKSMDDTLEEAQDQKKRHIAAKLLLRPGQRVLDIGSGWGGLALHLAQHPGVDVTGITLSTEQHQYANRRAEDDGLKDRVRFLLRDYRDESGRYERIVSVGMFEHVGIGHFREYFAKVRDSLTDDGVALIHTIGRSDGPGAANAWMQKYIFPGGYTPALSEITPVVERAGLHITDIEVLRLHYAETLAAWRQRFMAQRDKIADLYDDRFCRMWEFYLASCEAAFRHSGLVVFQIQLSKRIDAVPLTRDYISAWEQSHPLMDTMRVGTEASRRKACGVARHNSARESVTPHPHNNAPSTPVATGIDVVEEVSMETFPASDAPAWLSRRSGMRSNG